MGAGRLLKPCEQQVLQPLVTDSSHNAPQVILSCASTAKHLYATMQPSAAAAAGAASAAE
jgi:hypothetical protein